MSSFNRRTLLMLSAGAVLASCGFSPALAPDSASGQLLRQIAVDSPEHEDTYLLVRALEGRMGRPTDPRYALALAVKVEQSGLATTSSGDTTRYDLLGEVAFVLRDLQSDKVVAQGTVDSFTGYSTGSTVATLAAEQDARERLMTILADRIIARLIALAPEITG